MRQLVLVGRKFGSVQAINENVVPGMNLERALDSLCLDRIARFKRPKVYFFVVELPKNNAGKVLKTALREPLGEARHPLDGGAGPPEQAQHPDPRQVLLEG